MDADKMMTLTGRLSDEALTAELARLVGCERGTTAAVIAHLAEFAARGLHLAAGYPSLFAYCTEALRLSEHEAYNRMEAARLAVRFPEILDLVKDGALNLTAVRLLAPHLTEGNKERLLPEASYKSKREVEEVIVRYAPRQDVTASVRKLSTGTARPASGAVPVAAVRGDGVAEGGADGGLPGAGMSGQDVRVATQPSLAATAARPAVVRPLAVDRYAVRFTATAPTRAKIRMATDRLRHAVPGGDMGEVIDRALSALLEQLARQKFAAVQSQRSRRRKSPDDDRHGHTRHIPAAVKRTVWLRDGGRCAFVSKGLRRCSERGRLEFHHVQPYAVGGTATVDNIQMRCRAHNAFESDLFFGKPEPTASPAVRPIVGHGARPAAAGNSFQNELEAGPAARM
jgi:hypothetical protein